MNSNWFYLCPTQQIKQCYVKIWVQPIFGPLCFFPTSFGVLCHIIHIELQMVIVCFNFLFKPLFLFLTNSNTCFIICNLQMGGIDEPILDTLSFIKR